MMVNSFAVKLLAGFARRVLNEDPEGARSA
jgi:hypothetical protein